MISIPKHTDYLLERNTNFSGLYGMKRSMGLALQINSGNPQNGKGERKRKGI